MKRCSRWCFSLSFRIIIERWSFLQFSLRSISVIKTICLGLLSFLIRLLEIQFYLLVGLNLSFLYKSLTAVCVLSLRIFLDLLYNWQISLFYCLYLIFPLRFNIFASTFRCFIILSFKFTHYSEALILISRFFFFFHYF